MSNQQTIMQTNNARIIAFYKEHPNIDFETANLLLVEFLENVFNKMTNDTTTSVNSQILAFITENHRQMESIKTNLVSVQDNVAKMNADFSSQLMMQFLSSKKEYMEDIKQIISNTTLTANEKISSLMEKNNNYLIDKTSLILNENVPRQIKDSVKEVYSVLKTDTDILAKTYNSEKSFQEFIHQFDQKYSTMLQNVQQPLYSFFNATEDRIMKNLGDIKERSGESITTQTKMFGELSEFLGKYKVSSHKGNLGEERLCSVLTEIFPSADLANTSGTKASGDIIMKRIDKPAILFENKDYSKITDKDEVAKFIRDIDVQNIHGIFMSQHSGIALKNNFQIEIHKGNVLVYIQHCEYSPDKIKIAVDIIDSLSVKIDELNTDDEHGINQDTLDEMNREYQDFVLQKENALTTLRDFQKRMTQHIETIKMPALEKYLEPKYAGIKKQAISLRCDLCNSFIAASKQSLSAHKRGCTKKCKSTPLQNVVIRQTPSS